MIGLGLFLRVSAPTTAAAPTAEAPLVDADGDIIGDSDDDAISDNDP